MQKRKMQIGMTKLLLLFVQEVLVIYDINWVKTYWNIDKRDTNEEPADKDVVV